MRLIASINAKGEVAEVSIYESPHDEIKELALSVMFNVKFYPATCNGIPCDMDFQFEYDIRKTYKQMNTLHSEDIPGIKN